MVGKVGKDREASSVVKIDFSLLTEVEEFIKRKENRLIFVNKKQFIDIAVSDFLEKIKKETKNENKK